MTPAEFLQQAAGWQAQAACRDDGLEDLLFLDLDPADAIPVCETCPVSQACLAHAITTRATGVVQAGIAIAQRPIKPTTWETLHDR